MKIEPEHRRKIGDYFAFFREYQAGIAEGKRFIRTKARPKKRGTTGDHRHGQALAGNHREGPKEI